MEPIHGAVVSVSSAFADYGNLAARRAQKRNVFVGYLSSKLIHTLHADRDDGLFCSAAGNNVVRDVDAVHDDAVLIAARSRDGATIIPKPNLVAVVGGRTRLEGQE